MDEKDNAQKKLKLIQSKFFPGHYRHYKGGHYIAFALTMHENTLEVLVHYYSVGHSTRWTRTWENWISKVDDGPHTTPHLVSRFEFIRNASQQELLKAAGLG